jgi:hypothetical protein
MAKYISKKVEVEASRIVNVNTNGVSSEGGTHNHIESYSITLEDGEYIEVPHASGSHHNPIVDDYFITLSKTDRYVCPKTVFENKYLLVVEEEGEAPTSGFAFGLAVGALKLGKKLARTGWNGKGMYLYHVPANSYPAQTDAARAEFGDLVPYGAYIAMKTAQNNVVPWLASQTDVLAEDWEVVA